MRYVTNLYRDVPSYVYIGMLVTFSLGIVIAILLKGRRYSWQYIVGLLLAEYVMLIFCSTVVYRKISESVKFDYTPFWSYKAIQGGREDILLESIMNVIAFVPVGVLLWLLFRSRKLWQALAVGMGISVMVEMLQYVLNRGFVEFDDVFHNTLGCLIGIMIVALLRGIWLLQKRYLTS